MVPPPERQLATGRLETAADHIRFSLCSVSCQCKGSGKIINFPLPSRKRSSYSLLHPANSDMQTPWALGMGMAQQRVSVCLWSLTQRENISHGSYGVLTHNSLLPWAFRNHWSMTLAGTV